MLAIPLPGSAQSRSLPPIMQYGYLGYDFSMVKSDESTSNTHNALVNWNIASYFIKPYIAQYSGGLTFHYSLANASGTGDNTRKSIFGNLLFKLFPMSHFPFELYWNEEQSKSDQEQFDLTTSRRTYGLMQRYTSRNNTSTQLRIEQNEQTFDDRVDEKNQFGRNSLANLDITMPLGAWGLNWRNQYRKDENSRSQSSNKRWFSVLRHSWRPGVHFSMNGFTSYRDTTRSRQSGFSTQDRRAEFNNYLNWRPPTKRPLFISSTFRHIEFLGGNSDSDGPSGGTSVLTANMNYLFNDRLSFFANANGAVIRAEDDEDLRTGALVEGRFQSAVYRWGSFAYRWDTALGARWDDQNDEFGKVFTGVGRLGHSLDKVFFSGPQPLIVRFSQFLSALEGTDGQSTQNLTQSLSLNWNRNSTRRSTVLSFNITDNRSQGGGGRVGDQNRNIQLATLLFSQTENLSRQSRLTGSISVQARNQNFGLESDEVFTPSGTADISYFNRMLFRVPFLQYRSSLRWYSSDFTASLDDPSGATGTEGLFWENRLDYTLGRLNFRLFLRFSRVNDIDRNLIFFSVRRHFGGLLN